MVYRGTFHLLGKDIVPCLLLYLTFFFASLILAIEKYDAIIVHDKHLVSATIARRCTELHDGGLRAIAKVFFREQCARVSEICTMKSNLSRERWDTATNVIE